MLICQDVVQLTVQQVYSKLKYPSEVWLVYTDRDSFYILRR